MVDSKTLSLMLDFQSKVAHYPPAKIEYDVWLKAQETGQDENKLLKDKRRGIIKRSADALYPVHTAFSKPVNDFRNSCVLISNDIAVNYMIDEAAEFVALLERFQQLTAQTKSVQELAAYYKEMALKPKQILDALVNDLKIYAEQFNFETDVKTWVTRYQSALTKCKAAL